MTKTVLFFPLNSPGHINSSLGIADKLKDDHGYRTVFLILGPTMGNCIEEHGHELRMIDEVSPFQDYELEYDEDGRPINDELEQNRAKRTFPGVTKWPQIISRNRQFLSMDPVTALIESAKVFETIMVEELIENHDNYQAEIDSIQPDLIVIDAYFIPPCVVNSKIPWVRLFSANPIQLTVPKSGQVKPPAMAGFSLMSKENRIRLKHERPDDWRLIQESWSDALRKIIAALDKATGSLATFMSEKGCPKLEPGQQAHESPHINLYMYPKELDYDQDDDLLEYPPRWFRCDSLVRKPVDISNSSKADFWTSKLIEAKKGKDAVVFFSLGSIASGNVALMRRYVEILRKDPNRLYVFSKGINGDKYELNPGNMIGDNYIPQTFFLQRADLAIIHGGNNSITEVMYYGTPAIVLPVFADQFDNAQRLEELGLGRKLNVLDCSERELLQSIDEILANRTIRERVGEIGKQMRARDDSRKISNIIKKLTEEKHLDQEYIEEMRDEDIHG